jgi:Protein of unknown function (DUF3574)
VLSFGLHPIHLLDYDLGRLNHGLTTLRALNKSLLPIMGLATLMLAGCASQPRELAANCLATSEKPTAELLFGRVADGAPSVSELEFRRFISREVSPRFPDGLTVMNANGRWSPPAGSAIGERPKLVMIVLHGAADDQAKLAAIRAAYQTQYHQQSVLLPTGPGCVSL